MYKFLWIFYKALASLLSQSVSETMIFAKSEIWAKRKSRQCL